VHVDGRVLGRHDGIVNFTVGQRRGLGIAAGEALFVVRLESARRAVVVGPRAALGIGRLLLGGVNWLGDAPLEAAAAERLGLHVRIRSSQPPQPATLLATGPGTAAVVLAEPEHGVAPGQACVFYENDRPGARVLGGGWIRSTEASGVDAPDTCRSAPETPAMQDRAARTSM
jgi:tRNA-specific 2-thiouridylase